MAVVNKGVWGIDIGQSALKALRLEMVDGKPTATAFDYVEHTKILSQPDADPDTLIREALDKFLSRNDVENDDIAVGIAGQSGLARFVKLPPVEAKKIAEIVKFEAKQQIPFPLEEVVWDFQKIAGGEAVDGFALETEIGLFAMKRDVIARYLGYFTGSKVEVNLVQMSPLALVNFATYELLKKDEPKKVMGGEDAEEAEAEPDPTPRGKKRCTVVMDVGTDASNLIITDGAKIIWQRPIPLGGNNFTRALTKELKLTFAKAEHLKRNAAKSPDMPTILKAIKPVLTDFVGEVQRSLGYFTNTHRDAHVAHLVGLGSAFKLPGLQKYLADKLALEVKKPSKFTKLHGETVLNDPLFQENLLTFPVAYGLALQGLGQARLTTNLLPQEIRTDRMIRAKKPYAVAAAAMLLVGLFALAFGHAGPAAAIADPNIDKGIKMTGTAAGKLTTQEGELAKRRERSTREVSDTKAIIAGQEERLNWPRFIEVFTTALPRPGPNGNLNETNAKVNSGAEPPAFDQRQLWNKKDSLGRFVHEWFERRMREGVPVENAVRDEKEAGIYLKDLAFINIETVHTRWVDDVPGFLLAADTQIQSTYNIDIGIWMKDNERVKDDSKGGRWKPQAEAGGAWVIEIRGYTDHLGGRDFVHQGLLRNLQQFDKFGAMGSGKIAKFIKDAPNPVKGKVSHAFVYHVFSPTDAQSGGLLHIGPGMSYLDTLIGGGDGQGGSSSPGGKSGSPMPPSTTGGPTSPTGPMPGGAPMGQPGGAAGATTAPSIAPKWSGLGSTGGQAKPVTGAPVPSDRRRRYEFVVMLIWREPVKPIGGTTAPAP